MLTDERVARLRELLARAPGRQPGVRARRRPREGDGAPPRRRVPLRRAQRPLRRAPRPLRRRLHRLTRSPSVAAFGRVDRTTIPRCASESWGRRARREAGWRPGSRSAGHEVLYGSRAVDKAKQSVAELEHEVGRPRREPASVRQRVGVRRAGRDPRGQRRLRDPDGARARGAAAGQDRRVDGQQPREERQRVQRGAAAARIGRRGDPGVAVALARVHRVPSRARGRVRRSRPHDGERRRGARRRRRREGDADGDHVEHPEPAPARRRIVAQRGRAWRRSRRCCSRSTSATTCGRACASRRSDAATHDRQRSSSSRARRAGSARAWRSAWPGSARRSCARRVRRSSAPGGLPGTIHETAARDRGGRRPRARRSVATSA